MRNSMAMAAMATALGAFASIGVARPARQRLSKEQKAAAHTRIVAAEAKRQRRRERNLRIMGAAGA